MQRKIYLEGELGAKFGKEYTMNVSSFSEVLRCLECNFSNFRQYLISCAENNVGFVCEVAGQPLNSETELLLQYGEGDMVISTVPAGSKSAGAKILAAIAIIAVVYFTGGFTVLKDVGLGFGSLGQSAATIGVTVATNLALTGLSQMMAPDPSVDSQQDQSYLFQGTGQTIVEGDPVPVLYGKLRVPGRPISLQVKNERLNFIDHGKVYADSSVDTINGVTIDSSSSSGGGSVLSQEEQETQAHH